MPRAKQGQQKVPIGKEDDADRPQHVHRSRRLMAQPNQGFMAQLVQFEKNKRIQPYLWPLIV